MVEKREVHRLRRRVKVRFGVGKATKFGFTDDLCEQGFFIRSPQVEPPQTSIQVELELPGKETVQLQAQVRWAKRIPLQMVQRGKKGGMGVHIERFVSGEESFRAFFNQETSTVTV